MSYTSQYMVECTLMEAQKKKRELRAKVEELEAQVATMREALESLLVYMKGYAEGLRRKYQKRTEVDDLLDKYGKALSTTAGREMLERVRKLERVAEAARKAKGYIQNLITEEDCIKCEHVTGGECEWFDAYNELDEGFAALDERGRG